MGVSGQSHAPDALYPRERIPGTHWTGGSVGPRAGLDTEDGGKIICLCRGLNLDRPFVQPVVRHYTAWAKVVSVGLWTASVASWPYKKERYDTAKLYGGRWGAE
jgi:hypothetical protein